MKDFAMYHICYSQKSKSKSALLAELRPRGDLVVDVRRHLGLETGGASGKYGGKHNYEK
ncbi:hypothetical protein [Methanosphaerula palustris]|uniref:hypothetical protein n=1 Tax=Methanosphaerula palustris TaxID=475088 RepID=UPI00130508BE|nr:hypothetical protein [Methanosphaerula palustris]